MKASDIIDFMEKLIVDYGDVHIFPAVHNSCDPLDLLVDDSEFTQAYKPIKKGDKVMAIEWHLINDRMVNNDRVKTVQR